MSKVPYSKPALSSYADSINKLKDRGLSFSNEPKALHLLEVVSYYRLSGYWYPFLQDKQNHIFKPNVDFESVFNVYKFDRELRFIVTGELEKLEVAFRAKINHVMSNSISPFWYKDLSLYSSREESVNALRLIKTEFKRSKEDFVLSFKNKYSDEYPPSWIMLEFSSFGLISRIYCNLRNNSQKKEIASFVGIQPKVLESWLQYIVHIRNICAHHSRMWNRVFGISPMIPKSTQFTWLNNKNIRNNKAYFALSVILYLSKQINPKCSFASKVRSLFQKYGNIDCKAMGFPDGWEGEQLWE
ncbi:MAG: Abi family protein [Marinifilaceae bacterium]